MLKLSRGDYKSLKEIEGNMEKPNKKTINELSSLDIIYKKSKGSYMDNIDIENEKDGKLIKRIKKKFEIENDEVVKFMPQFIFAKNLRIILKDRNIKHIEFEQKYGLGEKMLSKYINGHQFPDFTIMCKIAYGLDMSVYQLLDMSKFTSLPIEKINKKIGLSEKSIKNLFMLQHNVKECNEITDDIPVSNQHRVKLDIFNSFIEDNMEFLKFLNCLEQYTKLKNNQENNQDINNKLLRIRKKID